MREMKRSVKICAMLLALVLVIGGVAIGIAATEGEPAAISVTSKNIAFDSGIRLAFKLAVTGEVEGYVGVAVWEVNDDDSYTLENVKQLVYLRDKEDKYAYAYYTPGSEAEAVVFSHGIAAKDVRTEYVFAPVLYDDIENETLIGESFRYSVAQYIEEMIAEGATADQIDMYNKLLAYADEASGVLGAD